MKFQTKTRSSFGMLLAIGLMIAFMGVGLVGCEDNSTPQEKFVTYQKYTTGDGVKIDDRRAGRALQSAADAGYFDAQMELALLYVAYNDKVFGALDIKRDTDKLDELLKSISKDILHAAEEGNTKAMVTLFFCYRKGKGFEKSEVESLSWLIKWINAWQKDASTDHQELLVMHGMCLEMKRNPDLAANFDADALATKVFTTAKQLADKDNAMAMYVLGLCYKDGIGTPISNDSAKKWFQKSADKGCKDALLELIKI